MLIISALSRLLGEDFSKYSASIVNRVSNEGMQLISGNAINLQSIPFQVGNQASKLILGITLLFFL